MRDKTACVNCQGGEAETRRRAEDSADEHRRLGEEVRVMDRGRESTARQDSGVPFHKTYLLWSINARVLFEALKESQTMAADAMAQKLTEERDKVAKFELCGCQLLLPSSRHSASLLEQFQFIYAPVLCGRFHNYCCAQLSVDLT